MKYWCDTEVEHLPYAEELRAIPYQYPAAIIHDNNTYMEVEIIPGTSGIREYVSTSSFDTETGVCVEMERRIWRGNNGMFVETFFIPLEHLGYDKEPVGALEAFSNAMQVI